MSGEKMTSLQKMAVLAPEGMLLAGITGLGYFSAYLSDLGYKSHFHIPSMFVEINLNSVVLSVCVIIFTLFIAFLSITVPRLRRVGPYLFSFFITASVAVVIGMKLGFSLSRTNLFTLIFYFLLCTGLLLLFFQLTKKENRITNLAAVMVLSGLMIFVSYSSGSLIAQNQKFFLVSDGKSPLVVVDTYKDSLVVAPFDPKTKTVAQRYQFVHLESDLNAKLNFSMKKVGPLNISTE